MRLLEIKNKIMNGWGSYQRKECDDDLKAFWEVRDGLSVCEEFICRGERVIPPGTVRSKLVSIGHEGHPGITRTKCNIKMLY